MHSKNLISRLFQPVTITPKNAVIKHQEGLSRSQKLMMDFGIIRQANPGCYHFLPLGVRAMEKLIKLVETEMANINAQKIEMSFLINTDLWKKTGRLEKEQNELFILKDRYSKQLILCPTNEEAVTDLISSVSPLSHRQLPLRLYQITNKFRDEMKPRFGLLRSRQFSMKDLYTFDSDIESAKRTYEQVCSSYEKIFDKIGIKYVKVKAATGNIGGTISHEFHYIAPVGEDNLKICNKCHLTINSELYDQIENCDKCKDEPDITEKLGIEVGHTFLLGNRYSKPLNATYFSDNGKAEDLQMGCFGLGISRLIAASIEVLCEKNELRWPQCFVPFKIMLIASKSGSKEEQITQNLLEKLYSTLNSLSLFKNDVIIDDRGKMTIGKRLLEARRVGYPYIVVLGSQAIKETPEFELHDLTRNTKQYLNETDLINYLMTS